MQEFVVRASLFHGEISIGKKKFFASILVIVLSRPHMYDAMTMALQHCHPRPDALSMAIWQSGKKYEMNSNVTVGAPNC